MKWSPGIPGYLDQDWVAQAVAALQCPETEAVLSSVRAPMTLHRFVSNFVHSFAFTGYRIDRVPLYELARCGLPVPSEVPGTARSASRLTGSGTGRRKNHSLDLVRTIQED